MLSTRAINLTRSTCRRSSLARRLSSATPPKRPPPPQSTMNDPHTVADNLIRQSEGRVQGTVAIQNYLTTEQKLRNYGVAGSLFCFVGWVFWYSMRAVGGSQEDSLESLAREAQANKASISEQEAQELAQLDIGVSEKDLDGDQVTLAVAAPGDIAEQEEERNKSVLSANKNKRPMWKRIVLFWKRE